MHTKCLQETNERLIPFLRNLADSIENGHIMPKELQRIGEFFMSYQFQKQADIDNDDTDNNNENMFTKKELLKICISWLVCLSNIIKKRNSSDR